MVSVEFASKRHNKAWSDNGVADYFIGPKLCLRFGARHNGGESKAKPYLYAKLIEIDNDFNVENQKFLDLGFAANKHIHILLEDNQNSGAIITFNMSSYSLTYRWGLSHFKSRQKTLK